MDQLLACSPIDDKIAIARKLARQRRDAREQGHNRKRKPAHHGDRQHYDPWKRIRRGHIRSCRHERHSISWRGGLPAPFFTAHGQSPEDPKREKNAF